MAEVLVKNGICEKCGAEIRPNALFCYNCGFQVGTDEEVAAEENVSSAWFKDTITEAKNEPAPKVAEVSHAEIKSKPFAEKIGEKPVATAPEVNKTQPPPKTTAAIKNKPKTTSPYKRVEVTWEAPQSPSNFWFLIVSLILLIFAAGLVFAMIYIK